MTDDISPAFYSQSRCSIEGYSKNPEIIALRHRLEKAA
jgi:hypothetical protein